MELNWKETLFLHFLFVYASTKQALIFFYFKSESFHIHSAVKGTRNTQDCIKGFEIRWGKITNLPYQYIFQERLLSKKQKLVLKSLLVLNYKWRPPRNLLHSYLSCMLWNFVTARLYVTSIICSALSPSYSAQNHRLCRSRIGKRKHTGEIRGSVCAAVVTVFTHSSSLVLLGRLGRVYWKLPVKGSWHRTEPILSELVLPGLL